LCHRVKLDVDDDRHFYSLPRIVKHVDERFLAQVTQLYRERIPPGKLTQYMRPVGAWMVHERGI
jgi:hypothetical protein